MKEDRNNLEISHKRVMERLQFVIILVFFFPTIIQAIFDSAGAEAVQASKNILSWGLVITMCVITYLLLEGLKKFLGARFLKFIDCLLLAQIALFIPALYILAYVANKDMAPDMYVLPLIISFGGMILIPLLVILSFVAYVSFGSGTWIGDRLLKLNIFTTPSENRDVAPPSDHSPESTSSSDQS